MSADNPILNSPYVEPQLHYNTDSEGALDYTDIRKGRRIFKVDSAVIPTRQTGQKEVFDWNEDAEEYITHIINLCRKEVGQWRAAKYPNTTRITKELMTFWLDNPERHAVKKLFFAQQEAVETAIWLNEVAEKSNAGQHILYMQKRYNEAINEYVAAQSYDPTWAVPRNSLGNLFLNVNRPYLS